MKAGEKAIHSGGKVMGSCCPHQPTSDGVSTFNWWLRSGGWKKFFQKPKIPDLSG